MSGLFLTKGLFPAEFFKPTVDFILNTQEKDGSIPWFKGSYADPWDHVEAAMGLSIGGKYEAAENAYFWLQNTQLADGSWWAAYQDGKIENHERRETNFIAYIATGVWHHFLITENITFVKKMWPTIEAAIEFVLSLQTEQGDIHWAVDAQSNAKKDALVTGCSSIYKSLECAYNLSVIVDCEKKSWLMARNRLGDSLRYHESSRFDRTWESKARYSMDWFYPVLTGVLPKEVAKQRLKSRWQSFVVDGMGCRCVSDQPWVTVAESCELTLALLAVGDTNKAATLFSWLHQWRLDDGAYWTGYQFAEKLLWPDEKPTWTAGAILLAADALTAYTPAASLFTSVKLLDSSQDTEGVNRLFSFK